MKKYLSIILSLVITFTCSLSALASSTPNTGPIEPSYSSMQIVRSSSKVLNESESILALMESYNISYEQAYQQYAELRSGFQRLEERHITYDAGMGYLIEVGCQVKVACGSGHCNFVEVIKEWSEASGSGSYTWNPFYVTVTIEGGIKKDTLRFQTRGALEVAIDSSMSAGFEAAGFSVSGTIGRTTYFRKVMSINQTKMMGQ